MGQMVEVELLPVAGCSHVDAARRTGCPVRRPSSSVLYIQSEARQDIAFYLLAVRVRPRCSQDQLF